MPSSHNTQPLTLRRDFLKQATALSGAFAFSTPGAAWAGSPNDRLGVACVGVGGMGNVHLDWVRQQPGLRVAAVCDVDARHLDAAAAKAPEAVKSKDFREVIDRDDVDVALVATPDHWHALVTIAAAKAGKHVYCEKPLANSIGEGRAMADAVRDAGVVLQTGSHERSSTGAATAKRLIAEGRFGEIHTVRIHLPNSDPHLQSVENFTSPPPNSSPPAGLDYDFWLGHTPVVPYNEKRCHFFWRFHNQFGGGEMTDRGAHVIDLAHWVLGLDDTGPQRVEAEGKLPAGDFYDAFITFKFANRYPSGLKMVGDNSGPRGLTLEGSAGKLFIAVHGGALTATPASFLEGVKVRSESPYDKHRSEFIAAIRGGDPVVAPAEAGHRTATACHLNNLAMRVGRAFDWDPQTERASDDEVNALLTPQMRSPWVLETS